TATFRPNSSLYRAAGRLCYAEAHLDGEKRSYNLVAVERNPYLDATLARAEAGATLDVLAAALVEDEIAREEAEEFIHQLIGAQILVSELAPMVPGPEPIHDLIAQLRVASTTVAVATVLEDTRAQLAELDASPLGAAADRYVAIAERLKRDLPAEAELA